MKILKFRAWHKYNQKMCNVRKMEFRSGDCPEHGYIWLDEEINPLENGQLDLYLMQYVGFKDKNNRPIYEGDIDSVGYVVTYLADLNEGFSMNAGWYLQRDNFESWSELVCDSDIEIIGNIFENPEKAINNCHTDYSKIF